jgi:hypothetical protein
MPNAVVAMVALAPSKLSQDPAEEVRDDVGGEDGVRE